MINKKILVAIATLAIFSCKKESANFVTFSGKITNKNSDSIVISNPQVGYKKTIKIDENGTFKDTLKITNGFFRLFDGKEYTNLYLQNGDNISMTIDAKQFDETVSYSGKGAEESNFLAKVAINQEQLFQNKDLFSLPKADFDTKVESYINDFNSRLGDKALDTSFVSFQKQQIEGLKDYLNKMHENTTYIKTTLAKGKTSPKFTDYENFKGGTTSLDDLKGKYVYIDLWATWCQPCKAEIPFLQKIEKQYHNKNIEFVSISVDEPRDYETWKKMVADKNMSGVQLYSNRDTIFAKAYRVTGIPRFILLDPQGNIVDANAPRPSNPKLIELFNSLKI